MTSTEGMASTAHALGSAEPLVSSTELRAELRSTRQAIGTGEPPTGLIGRLDGEKKDRKRMGRLIVVLALLLSVAQYGYTRHTDSALCIRGDNYRQAQLAFSDLQTQVYGESLHATPAQIAYVNSLIRKKAEQVQKLRACPGILPWTYNLPK